MYNKEEEFRNYKKYCMIVIKDMFGLHTEKYNIMADKIREAKTIAELSNVMSYGRSKLL